MSGYYRATWQFTVMTRDSGKTCFQFSNLLIFWFNLVLLFFKTI